MRLWRRFWTPAPGPLALLTGALAGLGLGVAAAALYGFSEPGRFLELFGFTFGIICAPISLVLVLAGAVIEKQPLPRAGLWGVMTLVLLGAGLFAAVGLGSSPEAGAEVGVFLYLLFCLPPAIGCAALALFFAGRGLPAARAVVAQTRADRALALLAARGETTLAELAVELGRPAGECGALVDDWLRAGQLNGFFDAPRGRVYTQAALRAKQQQLVAVVQARGQVTFDDLAAELRAPRELLRDWVYEAVRRGAFTGYLNWTEGVLYSADAQKLRGGRCPKCGGELALAGQGVVQCAHCGSEVFLA